jgi:hypothetical protein
VRILDGLDEQINLLRSHRGPYNYDRNYEWHTFDAGFAPAATFGQWVSAQVRTYAITGDRQTRDKVLRLKRLYAQTVSGFRELSTRTIASPRTATRSWFAG